MNIHAQSPLVRTHIVHLIDTPNKDKILFWDGFFSKFLYNFAK